MDNILEKASVAEYGYYSPRAKVKNQRIKRAIEEVKQNQFAARNLSFWEIMQIEKQAGLDKLWGKKEEVEEDA